MGDPLIVGQVAEANRILPAIIAEAKDVLWKVRSFNGIRDEIGYRKNCRIGSIF